jgi:hypothetical protein
LRERFGAPSLQQRRRDCPFFWVAWATVLRCPCLPSVARANITGQVADRFSMSRRQPPLARDHPDPAPVVQHEEVIVHAPGATGKLTADPGTMLVHLVNPDRTPPRYQSAIHVPRRPGNVVRRIRPLGRQPDYPHALSDLQRFLIHAIPRRRATQSTDIQPPRDLIKGKPAPPPCGPMSIPKIQNTEHLPSFSGLNLLT